jgi:spermidine synthase
VAAILIATALASWLSWRVSGRWKLSRVNIAIWIAALLVVLTSITLFQFRHSWEENYTQESNYYTIRVSDESGMKVLILDHLVHSYVFLDNPAAFQYGYEKIFAEIIKYATGGNTTPKVLHLGGGGYTFSRYMEAFYPGSANEVVEIDPR